MSTYNKIKELCERAGFSVSSIGEKIPGLSINRASVTGWKKGSMPRPGKLKIIADYFGVSIDYLTDNTESATGNGAYSAQLSKNSLNEQEAALLNIFEQLDVVKKAQLLSFAAELLK